MTSREPFVLRREDASTPDQHRAASEFLRLLSQGRPTAQPLFEAIWSNLKRLRPRGPSPERYVVATKLGSDAGAVGAAALILRPEPAFVAEGLFASARSA